MFPTFISIIDIQSWWEIPSIAHFCSLFRTAFNLLDFDIEDLEEALLTDGTEETSWLQDLIVRLLSGCLPNNEISTSNYQMFLRRLFRQKCQEHDRYNPFNTDIDFQLLPLRTKVDILQALCDFRLDADDVFDLLKNLEADSLRVEPLGYDSKGSAYWYFYGTRLYREDGESKNFKNSIWQVICFTEDDWYQLAKKFKRAGNGQDRQLYKTLSENFLPELPRLFKEKENLARKRLLENLPRRTSTRLRKGECDVGKEEIIKEDQEEPIKKEEKQKFREEEHRKKDLEKRRQEAYDRRSKLKEQSKGDTVHDSSADRDEMARRSKGRQRRISITSSTSKDTKLSKRNKSQRELETVSQSQLSTTTVGRQTNNSLSAATGQILIQPPPNSNKKRLKTSLVFRQTDEDLQTGMHKILDYMKNHEDAWPFVDPVEEEYAPNYYSIIRKPMDLQRMEERLDSGYYKNFEKFRSDFQLIVDNCRLYNGVENEYTEMVDNLLKAFERATEKYLDMISSSDDEIAIEYTHSEKKKENKMEEYSNLNLSSRRKPMLAAQTDKKRDRSLSEASEISRISDEFNEIETANDKSDKNVKKQKKNQKSKSSKLGKKQKKTSKIDKIEKETKDEYHFRKNRKEKTIHKKSIKTSKTKTKKYVKKGKKKSPSRSRSRSRSSYGSPPRSDLENSPISWPPSSPDEIFSINSQESRKRSRLNDSEDSLKEKKRKITKYASENNVISSVEEKIIDHPLTLSPKPKDKHNKLRETIEKLKAKSELKIRDEFDFDLDLPKENKDKNQKQDWDVENKSLGKAKEKSNSNKTNKSEVYLELEGNSTVDSNISDGKNAKKHVNKSVTQVSKPSNIDALTIATEQTLKDINKWLDDTPKFSEYSSTSNSPSHIGCEDFDSVSGKIDQGSGKKMDKLTGAKKETGSKDSKKRSVKDTCKFFKKREVQRTIDRLQPGKSKGNLISNVQNSNKTDEVFPLGPLSKIKDPKNSLIVKTDTNAPKLSLGSVLDSFGKHNFVDDNNKEEKKDVCEVPKENSFIPNESGEQEIEIDVPTKEEKEEKKDAEPIIEDPISGGGATPNLSAWFKAFGAPKIQAVQKKNDLKLDGKETEKLEDDNSKLSKIAAPLVSPNTDNLVMPHGQPVPRQRKISTGSSMSERSSFSQDMDSPRVGIDERGAYPAPYPSPMHRSPSGASPVMASPRPDISPKASAYPTINGQIRCGFYQDTVSNKSSPDKSCSPKEIPQSPYPHYSEHVYTPNTENSYYSYANSPYYTHAPNYSSTNPTPPYNMEGSSSYYDTSKTLSEQHQAKIAQNFTSNSPASDHSSPAHPQHSPSLVLSPHSPNIHSPHSPNIHSPHSPNVHSPHSPNIHSPHSPNIHSPHSPNIHSPHSPNVHSPHSPNIHSPHSPNIHSPNIHSPHSPNIHSPNIHSPSIHSQHSPTVSQNSPNIHLQNSPNFHSEQSPIPPLGHPSPLHSPNVPTNDSSNSPLHAQLSPASQNSPNLQIQSSPNLQIQNSPNLPSSPSPKMQTNLSETDIFQKQVEEIEPRPPQQTGQQSAIFPVKKRFYSDSDSQINNQGYEIDSKETQNHSTSELSKESPTMEKNYKTQSGLIDQNKVLLNIETRKSDNNNALSCSINPHSPQHPIEITNNLYSCTKFSNSYPAAYNREVNCPLNVPDTPSMQTNTIEMSKYTNMGYTGTEVNYSKCSLPYTQTDSNSLAATSHKPSTPMQIPSSVNQPLSQPIDISRLCNSNTTTSQRYKSVEPTVNLTIPQKAHSNFNSRTTEIPNQNVPSGYTADVTVPRPTYNSQAIDLEQPLGLGRNISGFSHIVDRYGNDERLLAGLQNSSSFYTDKGLGTSQLFNKPVSTSTSNLPILSQADMAAMQQCYNQSLQSSRSLYNRPITSIQNASAIKTDQKTSIQSLSQEKKKKRKNSKVVVTSSEAQQSSTSHQGFQSYAGLKGNSSIEPSAISLKTSSVVPGSAFNFGPTPTTLGINPSLYSDKDAYPNFLEEFRSAPNYYMAAAAHHRSKQESSSEKQVRTAHQSSNPQTPPGYPFLGASPQPRPTYPISGPFIPNPTQAAQLMDTSSPLYQHYLQSGVLNQGLLGPPGAYPPGYHPALSIRQPYDSITRPPWL